MHKLQPIVDTVLKTRRSKEDRTKNQIIAIHRRIQQYIKAGSKGDLDLNGTPITSLPDNLKKVGGYLRLDGSDIESLPDGLVTTGYIHLRDTNITSLPNGLVAKGLNLQHSRIESLPSDLSVKFSIFMFGTPVSTKYNVEQLKGMLPGVKGDIHI